MARGILKIATPDLSLLSQKTLRKMRSNLQVKEQGSAAGNQLFPMTIS